MWSKLMRSSRKPIFLLVSLSLMVGLLTFRQFGESWDELKFFRYGELTLTAYGEWARHGTIPLFGGSYDNYGPAYVVIVSLIENLLRNLGVGWLSPEIWHLVYFLTFQIGVIVFYGLCKRWMTDWAALGATLLFSTQPLIWGHAFISPKDVPFMVFFLLSISGGFKMKDALFSRGENDRSVYDLARENWARFSRDTQWTVITILLLWLVSVLALYLGINFWLNLLTNLIQTGYESGGQTWFGRLFLKIAANIQTIGTQAYLQKATMIFLRSRFRYALVSAILVIGFLYKKWPSALKLFRPSLVFAGVILGLTTSIRIIGPFAGVIVMAYLVAKVGKKAWPVIGIYGLIALVVMYATWPYLWPDPLNRFAESLKVMSAYPWTGQVLFDGVYYSADQIPWQYLPVLLLIQFTEPVWPLFLGGLAALIWHWKKSVGNRELLVLSLFWFGLPLLGFVIFKLPLYDNFRQLFFILPPVFMVAGAAIDVLIPKMKKGILRIAFLILLIFPAIFADFKLHPYEYIYYNSLIGGVDGAFRRFELDYWGTSFREAALYLNQEAPLNAKVWIEGPDHLFGRYARRDLETFVPYEEERAERYDYVVATTRYDLDLRKFPDVEVLHTIRRDHVVLAVIKQPD